MRIGRVASIILGTLAALASLVAALKAEAWLEVCFRFDVWRTSDLMDQVVMWGLCAGAAYMSYRFIRKPQRD